jgi:hypothetical protein
MNSQIGKEGNEMEMWGHSLPFWESIFRWATGIAAIAGGIAVTAAFVSTIVGYQITGRVQQESDKKISEANARTEEAKLEQERLKAQMAWRILSPDAASELERLLIVKSGSVTIEYATGDPEAQTFAIQLANIFGKAKWKVAINTVTYSGTVIFGLWIPDPPTSEKTLVRDAFTAIGVIFNTAVVPRAGRTMTIGGTIPNAPVVFVGSKPPPQ